MEKTNLTVRIDKEVLEKAKELKLNLSATTEGFLKVASIVKEKKMITSKELRNAYREVFQEIIKILKKWGISWYVKIGEYMELVEVSTSERKSSPFEHSYFLTPEGRIEDYVEQIGESVRTWKLDGEWPMGNIYDSQKIVSELVDTIYRSMENNKKKFEDMEILKSVLNELKNKEEDS